MRNAGYAIHFNPMSMFHKRTGEQLYGAGVAFGDALKFAAGRTPKNVKPALFGLSFDGGHSGVSNRSVYPICISALNYDGADPLQCGFVGFLSLLDVPASVKTTSQYLSARAHVLQRCIGAIVDELENVSEHGFTARLGEEIMVLKPFLVAIRVDSKERKTYFGLKSDRCEHTLKHTYIEHIYDYTYMVTHISGTYVITHI